jgi:hypothetical protein
LLALPHWEMLTREWAKKPMHRIYFDSNDRMALDLFGLWLDRSKSDLANIPGGPQDGMMVTIYMIGEIEMEAILEWSASGNAWTARPIEGTMRLNNEVWD